MKKVTDQIFLSDVRQHLNEVLKNATEASFWRKIGRSMLRLSDSDRALFETEVSALHFSDPWIAHLRSSMLASVTKKQAHFIAQSNSLRALEDVNADLIVNYLNQVWLYGITRCQDSKDLVALLSNTAAVSLLRSVANLLPKPKVAAVSSQIRRVAIYTPHIANDRHGGTTVTLTLAGVLSKLGIEYEIFSAQEAVIADRSNLCASLETVSSPSADQSALKPRGGARGRINLFRSDQSLNSRFKKTLNRIDRYAPDIILFVGLMSPLPYQLFDRFPVLGVSIHSCQPVVPLDLWLSHSDEQVGEIGDLNLPSQSIPFPYRFWPLGQSAPDNLSGLGVKKSTVVLVTAGYRLEKELSSEWIDQVRSILDEYPDAVWLLIGANHRMRQLNLQHDRIFQISPKDNLEAWLAASNIYLNPPRMGGGGSVVMAMEQGVPTVAFAGSDAGDKVGQIAVKSVSEYFELTKRWLNSPAERVSAGKRAKQRFEERFNADSELSKTTLAEGLERCLSIFKNRTERE